MMKNLLCIILVLSSLFSFGQKQNDFSNTKDWPTEKGMNQITITTKENPDTAFAKISQLLITHFYVFTFYNKDLRVLYVEQRKKNWSLLYSVNIFVISERGETKIILRGGAKYEETYYTCSSNSKFNFGNSSFSVLYGIAHSYPGGTLSFQKEDY